MTNTTEAIKAARTTEMRNWKGPQDWVARIEAALVPGTFLITPNVYTSTPDPLYPGRSKTSVTGGEVFCAKCAGWLNFTDYQTVTITTDDTYYCENC